MERADLCRGCSYYTETDTQQFPIGFYSNLHIFMSVSVPNTVKVQLFVCNSLLIPCWRITFNTYKYNNQFKFCFPVNEYRSLDLNFSKSLATKRFLKIIVSIAHIKFVEFCCIHCASRSWLGSVLSFFSAWWSWICFVLSRPSVHVFVFQFKNLVNIKKVMKEVLGGWYYFVGKVSLDFCSC